MQRIAQLFFIVILFLFTCVGAFAQNNMVTPLRGAWVTNVASEVLHSKENIQKAVLQAKSAGLNSLFVVVWNGGYTLYPSKVQQRYIGVKQHPTFQGRDPLREIVEEGHRAGLKVHAWFEFGFSYAYKDTNSLWLKKDRKSTR